MYFTLILNGKQILFWYQTVSVFHRVLSGGCLLPWYLGLRRDIKIDRCIAMHWQRLATRKALVGVGKFSTDLVTFWPTHWMRCNALRVKLINFD